jgi:hypothetical protein
MAKDIIPAGQFGPLYPDLPTVKKHRKAARDGLASLSADQRRAYGEAVEIAIRAKQRAELQRELPTHICHCASGTNHNDGAAIHKAMQAKQRAALLACPSQVRRARTAHEWEVMYAEAMADKATRRALSMIAIAA